MGCQRSGRAAGAVASLLEAGAIELDLSLGSTELARFWRYSELLIEHGGQYNLTSVLDRERIQRRHFLESLAAGAALAREGFFRGEQTLVDVGSGAGFPGLPLAIVWPELQVTLIEATGKKANFIALVARELGLAGIAIVNARAEDAARRPELREQFGLATARAVAPLSTLVELTLPFVRVGGIVAAFKGSRLEGELAVAGAALRACGAGETREVALGTGSLKAASRLLLIAKLRHTPPALPRSPGIPSKTPLH